jgi:hypothetical protein
MTIVWHVAKPMPPSRQLYVAAEGLIDAELFDS